MKKHTKMSMLKRILAVVLAAAVAVSILTVPDAEVSAATGKVKSVAVTNLPAKQLTLKKGKSFTLKTKVSVSGKKVPIRPVTRKLLLLMQKVRSQRRKREQLRSPFTLKQIRKRPVRSR
mgnify:CR=1 FL=1